MQMKKPSSIKGLILSTIALCSLLLSGNAAYAALVTYSFTGGVSSISGALLSPTMNLTSPVMGSFQFDNTTGGSSHLHVGNYPGAVTGMNLSIGGYTSAFTSGANAITLSNDVGFGDRWRLVTDATGTPTTNGYTPIRFDLQLDHEGGGAFNNTALQNPPSLSSLTANRWRLIFENADGNLVRVQGSFNSLTAVPLPAAVILFGAGLISLVGLGAGGLRNLRRPHQA
ncbi:MAG: hypothetical protein ABIU05_11925 [Nitrospirales bacterium]